MFPLYLSQTSVSCSFHGFMPRNDVFGCGTARHVRTARSGVLAEYSCGRCSYKCATMPDFACGLQVCHPGQHRRGLCRWLHACMQKPPCGIIMDLLMPPSHLHNCTRDSLASAER